MSVVLLSCSSKVKFLLLVTPGDSAGFRKEPKIKDFLRVHWLQVPPSQSWVTKWVTTKIGARKRPPFLAFLSDKPAPKRKVGGSNPPGNAT